MYSSYLLALTVALAAPTLRLPSRWSRLSFGRAALPAAAASCALLVVTFALQQHVLFAVARELRGTAPILYRIPIIFIDWTHPGGSVPLNTSTLVELLALVQVGLLSSLYVAARQVSAQHRLYPIVALAAAALAALSLESRLTLDPDMYSYLGLATVKPNAYVPGHYRFAAPYDAINVLWGQPMLPSVYGPFWIAITKVAIGCAHTFFGKLLAIRLVEFGALILSVLALVGTRVPFAVVAVFAVDPALYEQYLLSAHNDLLAVAFVLLASLASRRWLSWAVLLVVAAAAIKLPFAVIGALSFATQPSLSRRTAAIAATWSLTAIVYVLYAPAYFGALHGTVSAYRAPVAPTILVPHVLLALLALGAVVMAVASRRTFAGALWSFVSLAEFECSQYLAWGLPYAAMRPKLLVFYLVSLPFAAYELAFEYAQTPLYIAVRDGLFLALILALALRWARWRKVRRDLMAAEALCRQ